MCTKTVTLHGCWMLNTGFLSFSYFLRSQKSFSLSPALTFISLAMKTSCAFDNRLENE